MTGREHEAVLLEEAVTALAIRPDGRYVDATFGRGGHSRAILERLGPAGELLAFDRDADAVASAGKQWAEEKRFTIVHRPFSQLTSVLDDRGWCGQVHGILFDLGVSSPQLDNPERGFSFRLDGPLDMRMDVTRGESAADWLARAEEQDIADVIYQLGEERYSRRIARTIVAARRESPITTTGRLSAIVAGAVPTRERRKDPATRTFQALRLHVNRELDEIRDALPQALAALAPGGRLVVISFHSLEDRIVKNFMRDEARPAEGTPRLRLLGKQRPPEAEVARNPRARSAMLRVAEVIGHA